MTTEESILFKIDVKLGQRIITLNVEQNDTISLLLKRNQIGSQMNAEKRKKLKQKVIQNIQDQLEIKMFSNQFQLAKKMKSFLEKQELMQKKQNLLHQEELIQDGTPLKFLSVQSSNQRSQNLPLKNQNTVQNVKILLDKSQKKKSFSKPEGTRKSNEIKKKTEKNIKSIAFKKTDEDLIKAYETILKKSKDKCMRQMAEKMLRQLNGTQSQNICRHISTFSQNSIQNFKIGNDSDMKSAQGSKENTFVDELDFSKGESKSLKVQSYLKNASQKKQLADSSSTMKKSQNRYCYLNENSQLYYPYKQSDPFKEKQSYKYNCLEQPQNSCLKVRYGMANYEPKNTAYSLNRRFNYLNQ